MNAIQEVDCCRAPGSLLPRFARSGCAFRRVGRGFPQALPGRRHLAQLDGDARADYDVRVACARIAYHERYFAAVRKEARTIAEEYQDLPEWLQVFHGASDAADVKGVAR